MFLNKDQEISIIQLVEMQWRAYLEFIKLTDSKAEARKQTEIFMKSLQKGAEA